MPINNNKKKRFALIQHKLFFLSELSKNKLENHTSPFLIQYHNLLDFCVNFLCVTDPLTHDVQTAAAKKLGFVSLL